MFMNCWISRLSIWISSTLKFATQFRVPYTRSRRNPITIMACMAHIAVAVSASIMNIENKQLRYERYRVSLLSVQITINTFGEHWRKSLRIATNIAILTKFLSLAAPEVVNWTATVQPVMKISSKWQIFRLVSADPMIYHWIMAHVQTDFSWW